MHEVRNRMERLNRVANLIWSQRNERKPSMTAQVDFVNGMYRYQVYDISTYDPYKPILLAYAPSMGHALRKVLAFFAQEEHS